MSKARNIARVPVESFEEAVAQLHPLVPDDSFLDGSRDRCLNRGMATGDRAVAGGATGRAGGGHPTQGEYLAFYWPLALMGMATLIGRQFQNGTLSRYPNASRELATFAYAASTFELFAAALGFLPQMINVLGRSRAARRVCLRFTLLVCVLLSLPVAFMAFTPGGGALVARVFSIGGARLAAVVLYLRWLCPLVLIGGLRHHYTGLLVQARRTGVVTVLNVTDLATTAAVLVAGFHAGWRPVRTLATARLTASVLVLALTYGAHKTRYDPALSASGERITYRQAWSFFWPVALTSIMFALSRPILYSFVSRAPGSEPHVAALRVAFDFALIFHMPVNSLRHLFATFGTEDLAGVRRFMVRLLLGVVGLMALVACTPLNTFVLRDLLGVEGEVLVMARDAVRILCLVPLVVAVRNYYHGLALVSRRTVSMGVGSLCRNGLIYLAAWAAYAQGALDHLWAAMILVFGFTAETAGVVLARYAGARRRRSGGGR
ncbi:MAG: hypothetical protein JXR37_31235 [Kiritimatiellae bacterium]|nr:hypothetical protein [Kiritimatiellia bacterium]